MKLKSFKKTALLLVFAMLLTALAPATGAEAAASYKNYTNGYGKAGCTTNITGLKQLLKSDSHVYAYVKNLTKERTYSIPEGDYSDLRLRVNAPKSVVWNSGTFKIVKISDLDGQMGWHEYAKGNSFSVVDTDVKMYVEKDAAVDRLYFKADEGKVNLSVRGDVRKTGFYGDNMDADISLSTGSVKELRVASEGGNIDVNARKESSVDTVKIVKDADVEIKADTDVKEIVLDSKADVMITGNAEKIEVTVTEKAEGAKVETSVPVEVNAGAKVELTLNDGAEGTTVTKADEKVEVAVDNNTSADVVIGIEGSDKTETVESGSDTATDGDTTTGGGNGGYVPPVTPPVDPDPKPEEPVVATGVAISLEAVELETGKTQQLTATVTPANAEDKTVTWSSNNTAVATVDANGLVTAVAAGTAVITAKTVNGLTDTCTVTVTKVDVEEPSEPVIATGITLNKTTIELQLVANQTITETLTATITPGNTTNKNVNWNSNDESVVTVENGVVTAVGAGTTTVVATSLSNQSLTAICEVTVKAEETTEPNVPVENVTLEPTLTLKMGESETATLTATITPDNATNQKVTWTSSKPEVATVDNTGKVTAVAAGETTITVTTEDGGKSATCAVTVNAADPTVQPWPDTNVSFAFPSGVDSTTEGLSNDENWLASAWDITATGMTLEGTVTQTKLTEMGSAEFPVFVKIPLASDAYTRFELGRVGEAPFTSFDSTNSTDVADWKGWITQGTDATWFKFGYIFAKNEAGSWTKEADRTYVLNVYNADQLVGTMTFTVNTDNVSIEAPEVPEVPTWPDTNVSFAFPSGVDSTTEGLSNDENWLASAWDITATGMTLEGTVTQTKLTEMGSAEFPVFVKIPLASDAYTRFELGRVGEAPFTSFDSTNSTDVADWKGWITQGTDATWFKFGYIFAKNEAGSWTKEADRTYVLNVYNADQLVGTMTFTVNTDNVSIEAPEVPEVPTWPDTNVSFAFPSGVDSTTEGLSNDENWLASAWDITATGMTLNGNVTQTKLTEMGKAEFPVFVKIPLASDAYTKFELGRVGEDPFTSFDSTNSTDVADWKGWITQGTDATWFKFGYIFAKNEAGSWTKEADRTYILNVYNADQLVGTMTFTVNTDNVSIEAPEVPEVPTWPDTNVSFAFPSGVDSTTEGLSNDENWLASAWDITATGMTLNGNVTQTKLTEMGKAEFPVFVKIPLASDAYTKFELGRMGEDPFTSFDSTNSTDVADWKGWITQGTDATWFKFGYIFAKNEAGSWTKEADRTYVLNVYNADQLVGTMTFAVGMTNVEIVVQ